MHTWSPAHTLTHSHTPIHTLTRTMHSHTFALIHAHMHLHALTLTFTLMLSDSNILTRSHAHTHAHTYTHTLTFTHSHSHALSHTHFLRPSGSPGGARVWAQSAVPPRSEGGWGRAGAAAGVWTASRQQGGGGARCPEREGPSAAGARGTPGVVSRFQPGAPGKGWKVLGFPTTPHGLCLRRA